jgi:hypothetical protein
MAARQYHRFELQYYINNLYTLRRPVITIVFSIPSQPIHITQLSPSRSAKEASQIISKTPLLSIKKSCKNRHTHQFPNSARRPDLRAITIPTETPIPPNPTTSPHPSHRHSEPSNTIQRQEQTTTVKPHHRLPSLIRQETISPSGTHLTTGVLQST